MAQDWEAAHLQYQRRSGAFLHAAAPGREGWPSLSRNVLQPGQPARHSADAEAGAAVWRMAGAGFEF